MYIQTAVPKAVGISSARKTSVPFGYFWKTNDNLFLSYCPCNSDIQRFWQFSRPNLRGGLIMQIAKMISTIYISPANFSKR
jgi:hypothetical protein